MHYNYDDNQEYVYNIYVPSDNTTIFVSNKCQLKINISYVRVKISNFAL